jgi:hypothetical protein
VRLLLFFILHLPFVAWQIGLVAFAKLYGSRLATKLMMLERADEEAYVQARLAL